MNFVAPTPEPLAADLAAGLLNRDGLSARRSEVGVASEVFFVSDGSQEFVLRLGPPDDLLTLFYERLMMRREPPIHARLVAETRAPVPLILGHDFSRARIDRDFLILPRLPGRMFHEAGLSGAAGERALRQWGRHTRAVHSLVDPAGRFGYLDDPPCMEPQTTWREAFTVMYRRLLDDCSACGVYDRETSDAAMRLLEENTGAFEHCDTPRLLHGDLWVSNVLVAPDGEVTGLIDFNRACWGDPEWDLAIAEYCGVARAAFWEGYNDSGMGGESAWSGQSSATSPSQGEDGALRASGEGRTTIDRASPAFALRRFFYLLYEHQKYIVISMSDRRNDPAGARRYASQSLAAMERYRRTGDPVF